jgi:hypothetical protein
LYRSLGVPLGHDGSGRSELNGCADLLGGCGRASKLECDRRLSVLLLLVRRGISVGVLGRDGGSDRSLKRGEAGIEGDATLGESGYACRGDTIDEWSN